VPEVLRRPHRQHLATFMLACRHHRRPLGAAAVPLPWLAVRESHGRSQRLDLRGTLMLGGAVFPGSGGELTPTGYDRAIGPALLVGAGAGAVATVAAFFAPRRTRAPQG
jgi:hypothetical protein